MAIKNNLILLAIALSYTIFPLLIAFLGVALAALFGCESRGGFIVCADQPFLGQLLTNMTIFHWLGLITVPSGGIISGVLLIMLLIQYIKK
ncbi:hypothetical protein ACL6C3_02500 [Capilliphycus salinus ALCB114379]|uniref:hypothetical protein n=1 Tax=Capilliphycus salinus TaxID=2768948 RepID=UPI0039A48224